MHKKNTLWKLIIFLFCASNVSLLCAKPIDHDPELWSVVKQSGYQKSLDALYTLQFHVRLEAEDPYFDTAILRGGLGKAVNPRLNFWLGYDFIPFTQDNPTRIEYEHRPWQQLIFQVPTESTPYITLRTRLEERYQPDESGIALRLRQRATLTFKEITKKSFTPIAYEEVFFNPNNPDWVSTRTLSQNRVFLGGNLPWTRKRIVEMGYVNQYQARNGSANQMNHIFSVSVKLLP